MMILFKENFNTSIFILSIILIKVNVLPNKIMNNGIIFRLVHIASIILVSVCV